MHVVDHEGNKFFSAKEMCKYWGIEYWTFLRRKKAGWALKDILTIPKCQASQKAGKRCEDHLGNKFNSMNEMCKFHNISVSTFKNRVRKGYSIEECLSSDKVYKRPDDVVDHTGRHFRSLRRMASYWDLSLSAVQVRLNAGWSLKDALETPKNTRHALAKVCEDHLGNKFPSKIAMCRYHNVSVSTFKSRLDRGLSLEKALAPVNRKHNKD